MKDFAFRSKPIVFQRTPPQRRSRHVPEAVVSAPRGGRVTSQRRLRLLPDSPTGIGALLSGCSFLEGSKKSPKRRNALGYLFSLVYKEALITSLG